MAEMIRGLAPGSRCRLGSGRDTERDGQRDEVTKGSVPGTRDSERGDEGLGPRDEVTKGPVPGTRNEVT